MRGSHLEQRYQTIKTFDLLLHRDTSLTGYIVKRRMYFLFEGFFRIRSSTKKWYDMNIYIDIMKGKEEWGFVCIQ